METTTHLAKRKATVRGKDRYLLGTLKSGETFWLEEPSWDCGWYWGAGYVETVNSHSHYSGMCGLKLEHYDHEKECYVLGSKYINILSDNPEVASCVLSTSEQWQLSDYMKSIYALKEAAEVFGRGSSHCTTVPVLVKDEAMTKHINEVLLPRLFAAVRELLTKPSLPRIKA